MNVLIIGQGGREHALAWKVARSEHVDSVWVAPGNAGTTLERNIKNIEIASTDVIALLQFAQDHAIALTIVGPEVALAAGIVDAFQEAGLPIFGPPRLSAQLESSKVFSKQFMRRYGIPTADFRIFSEVEPAIDYLSNQSFPVVIKADGLAAGKGVIIASCLADAQKTVIDILEDRCFGPAGQHILIEKLVLGEEMSFIAIVHEQQVFPLATSCDYKKLEVNNRGLNTGGMGAYSPALCSDVLVSKIMSSILLPTVRGLQQENLSYTGFLYAGLMMTPEGDPVLLEFNVRLGDPETQPLMMRLRSDLVVVIQAALDGRLTDAMIEWDTRAAVAVVMTAAGYPKSYQQGDVITGLAAFPSGPECKAFHSGTRCSGNNAILTQGGRVLSMTALGDDIPAAREKAYQAIRTIHWPGCYYRSDIAKFS